MFNNNPVIQENALRGGNYTTIGAPMTIGGSIVKTFVLLLFLIIPAFVTWYQFSLGYMDKVQFIMMAGLIVGFILALIITFKQTTSPYLAPVYAFCEGAFLGGFSAQIEAIYPGIAIQGIALTFMTTFAMLVIYKTGLIKVTDKFKAVLLSAMGGIFLLYLISFILSFFGKQIPYLFSSSPIGIGFSIFVVIIAALSLLPNFDFIEKGSQMMLPKYMEWYNAFGVMVTLVWLYMEIVRLLAKLSDNNR